MKPLCELSKQNADALLRKCADGEALLYVALRPFTANLRTPNGREAHPSLQERRHGTAIRVPLNRLAAGVLLEFPDAKVSWFEPVESLDEARPEYGYWYFLKEPQTVTRDQVYCELPLEDRGPDAFKSMDGLTSYELTIRLMRTDEVRPFDRLKIEARGKSRTMTASSLGLCDKRTGALNRAGQTLETMQKGVIPKNIKAPAQAMKELRKIIKGLGIMDKDPFHPKRDNWKPKFNLKDQIEEADKRAKERAIHEPYDETIQYDKEDDTAGEWLKDNDK